MTQQKTPEGEPALGISYTITLDDKRALVTQTFIERDCTPDELNALLDKLATASNRQYARTELKGLRRQLELQEKQFKRVTEDLGRIDEQQRAAWGKDRRGEFKLQPKEQAHRDNVLVTQSRFQEEIDKIKAEIVECEKLAS